MKNTFLTAAKNGAVALALVVLVVAPFQPLVALADPITPGDTNDTRNAIATPASDASSPYGNFVGGSQDNGNLTNNPTNNPNGGGSSTGSPTPISNCSIWGNGSLNPFNKTSGSDLAQCFTDVIYVFTVGIGSGFAYVSAYFFDWTVALSLNGSIYALDFVSQGWTTARDIANMAFLFILLFIAFKIIFEAETNETVHMLTWVIIIALIVNFSFFFTRLVIDAGNILSIQFYNAIDVPSVGTTASGAGVQSTAASTFTSVAGNAAAGTFTGGTTGFSNSKDLTFGIMGMLNLQGLLGNESFQAFRNGNGSNFLTSFITLSFLYIAAGIMLWLLTVAFITNGVKFLFRIVVLWFLIIASPLAFVARAVPKFKTYYDQWQDALIKHAFYPAAFMFIFLILTNFANQMGKNNALINGLFNGANTQNASSMVASLGYAIANVGIRMGFVIAMLYIGMEASKRIGIMGADAAHHAGNWVGGKMIGTYGAVGRNTLGWAGNAASRNAWLREQAASGGLLGRTLWRGADKMGKASMDFRSAPGLKSILGKDIVGEAQGKGGYKAAFDARVKTRRDEAEALQPTRDEQARANQRATQENAPQQQAAQVNLAAATQAEVAAAQAEERAAQALQAATQNVQNLASQGQQGTPQMQGAMRAQQTARTVQQAAQQARNNAREDLTRARAERENVDVDISRRAAQLSGANLHQEYARSITTRSWRNLWQAPNAIPFYISRSNREARARIVEGRSENERTQDILRDILRQSGQGTN